MIIPYTYYLFAFHGVCIKSNNYGLKLGKNIDSADPIFPSISDVEAHKSREDETLTHKIK